MPSLRRRDALRRFASAQRDVDMLLRQLRCHYQDA